MLPADFGSCSGRSSAVNPGRPLGICITCQRRLHISAASVAPVAEHVGGVWVCALRLAEVEGMSPPGADGAFAPGASASGAISSVG